MRNAECETTTHEREATKGQQDSPTHDPRLRHLPGRLLLGVTGAGLLMAGGAWFIGSGLAPAVLGLPGLQAPHLNLVGAALALQPALRLCDLLALALSRRQEFQADRFAATALGGPAPMIGALTRLAAGHLAHPDPHPLWIALHASHPPVPARVGALRD